MEKINKETTERVKLRPRRFVPFVAGSLALMLIGGIGFFVSSRINKPGLDTRSLSIADKTQEVKTLDKGLPLATHLPLPVEVRGIYATASTASSLVRYKALLTAVKEKGINAVVLDVKTDDGSLAFLPHEEKLSSSAPVKKLITDLDAVVGVTHGMGMYLIARIPVFEDPAYAKRYPKIALQLASGGLWKDAKGLAWLDPAATEVWKYNAEVAREVYKRGFDEIQFDYIRFATDGSTSRIVYPVFDKKKETMRNVIGRFFSFLDLELRRKGIPISADLFGFTTWHQNDLGIGQWYSDAITNFDFVSPMVYPSHYPAGTLGFKNPAVHPYEIVLDSLKKGNEVIDESRVGDASKKLASQRPWIQAFNMGATYTPEMVSAQVRASRESGASGFLFWNAANNYSSLPKLSNYTSNL